MTEYVTLNGKVIQKPKHSPQINYASTSTAPIFILPTNNKPTFFETPIIKMPTIKTRKTYTYHMSKMEASKEIKQFDKIRRYRRCYNCNKRFIVSDLSDYRYHYCNNCKVK